MIHIIFTTLENSHALRRVCMSAIFIKEFEDVPNRKTSSNRRHLALHVLKDIYCSEEYMITLRSTVDSTPCQ